MRSAVIVAGLMILFGGAGLGQVGGIEVGVGFGAAPVSGAPYSAQQIREHRQTLADGTHIEDKPRTMLIFRDSQGRTRTEQTIASPNGDADGPPFIQIQDPVSGFLYTLDTQNHIAHRVTMGPRVSGGSSSAAARPMISAVPPPPPPPPPPTPTQSGTPANRMQHTSESLGTQVMEGITVEGRRTTTTIPVGMQGNDRPLVSTIEIWRSAELHLIVSSKTSDPRNGETVTRMTNITVGEPDPALFQPPADYTIVDDTRK